MERGTLREATWSPDSKPTVIVETPGISKFLLESKVVCVPYGKSSKLAEPQENLAHTL